MRKQSWQYRFRVQTLRSVYCEPVKRTDDLATAIKAADKYAADMDRRYYVWDNVEGKRVYIAVPGQPWRKPLSELGAYASMKGAGDGGPEHTQAELRRFNGRQ